ncbi:hypothetical protein JW992_12620 [candidate division KSB1 bacterium]|nr:hypothetical protein [candidate division KSB1 bacterium]
MKRHLFYLLAAGIVLVACQSSQKEIPNFSQDLNFLQKHTEVVLLSDPSGQRQVAVCPAYQGRVMTSTAAGADGPSFGWINRELIASGKNNPHINAFGGEDRFWLGPEGGQFSIFFNKDAPFDLDHWFTPEPINEEDWPATAVADDRVSFSESFQLENYSGTLFEVKVDRTVRLLDEQEVIAPLQHVLKEPIDWVGFASENRLTNSGDQAWSKSTGLLSIWILGMFQPSDNTTIVIPYTSGPDSLLGPVVNDAYFGRVPEDRLKVGGRAIFFSGDGRYRSKIGLSPQRSQPVLGSYDADNGVLTIVTFTLPKGLRDYVNSMWELQDEPYRGDAINSYNDGPPEPGAKPLGPFYELETSSPAIELLPGKSLIHIHRTIHFRGTPEQLDPLAQELLGVRLEVIENALR